jgi:hypothetical protein
MNTKQLVLHSLLDVRTMMSVLHMDTILPLRYMLQASLLCDTSQSIKIQAVINISLATFSVGFKPSCDSV